MAILNLIPRLAAFQPHLFTGEPGEIDSCSNILHVTLGIDLLYMVLVKVLEMLELERKRSGHLLVISECNTICCYNCPYLISSLNLSL